MIFEYNGKDYEIDEAAFAAFHWQADGISNDRWMELWAKMIDTNIPVTPDTIEMVYNAEHRGRADEFLAEYPIRGSLKRIPMEYKEESKSLLTEIFRLSNKFHGRVPAVIDSIVRIYDFFENHAYPVEADTFVQRFNIPAMQTMLRNRIPQCYAVLLYMHYTPEQCQGINLEIAENVCRLLVKGYKDQNWSNVLAANWIMEHTQTNMDTLKKISKEADRLHINPETTVECIENRINNLSALNEVKKIEKAYKTPKFKLKNCTCELKDVEKMVSQGRYQAYIMHGTDERQVMLGYDTHCCQKLGDAGESAMMHGLLNPKAGFFVIEEKSTGIIKAQAEVWEENENTLVFDNIELANDAELDLYKPILKQWLAETAYSDVKMGTGYNEFMRNGDRFRHCGNVTPTITPYEAYVLSYEDDSYCEGVAEEIKSVKKAEELIEQGRITYYDYVYCDSENHAVWLKENGILEPYFTGLFDKEVLLRNAAALGNNTISLYATQLANQSMPMPEPDYDDHEEEEIEEEEPLPWEENEYSEYEYESYQ